MIAEDDSVIVPVWGWGEHPLHVRGLFQQFVPQVEMSTDDLRPIKPIANVLWARATHLCASIRIGGEFSPPGIRLPVVR